MLLKELSRVPRLLTGKLSLIELVAWGILYYTFAVFLPAMKKELGWSSAILAMGFSLALLVAGLVAPFVGSWIDRHGSRNLMLAGSVIGSLGILLWSYAYTIPIFFGAWFLIGCGMATTLYPPAFATIVHVTKEKSRHPILIITVVGALASTIFMPLSSLLEDIFGWREALVLLAIIMAGVTIPLTAFLPNVKGSGEDKSDTNSEPSTSRNLNNFWTLAIALMLADAASIAINVHLVMFLVDNGQPLGVAAGIAGIAGIAKIGGRLGTAIGTHFSTLTLLRLTLFIKAMALLLPLLWSSIWAFIIMVIVFGATGGARTILRPALVVEMYGSKKFGRSNGLFQLCTTLAKVAGPVVFGVVIGIVGRNWSWSFLALLVSISGVLLFRLNTSPTQLRQQSFGHVMSFFKFFRLHK